jgi:hypothetical protein
MLFQPLAPHSKPISPCSVFELADRPIRLRQNFAPSAGRPPYRLERTESVTRYIVVQVQDTDAWKASEAARRARQIVPRPGSKVKAAMNAMKAPGRGFDASKRLA